MTVLATKLATDKVETPRSTAPKLTIVKFEAHAKALDDADALAFARSVLESERDAVAAQIERLDSRFCAALELIENCRGSVVVTGMGKAGLIGRKLSATLSSTGSPSHFMHTGEAYHGDLGSISSRDVVLALSYSGETEEVKRILAPLRERKIPIIAIVSTALSALGRAATSAALSRVRSSRLCSRSISVDLSAYVSCSLAP